MKVKEAELSSSDTTRVTQISLPSPKVELPEISYDKAKLSKIQELDQMLMDAEIVKVASAQFDEMFMELKNSNQYGSLSGDGTPEGRIRAINKVADSFKKFDASGKILGEKIIAFVREKYHGESEFTSKYRDTYYEAEEQVNEMILDNALRRKVWSEMSNTYKYGSSVSIYFVESKLKEAVELRGNAISSLLSSASTDLLIADYQKGKNLTDLLNGTMNLLNALQSLDPSENEVASIRDMKMKVEETRKKRMGEIAAAREAYRFPSRYTGGNTPSNAVDLEKRMEAFLEKFTYNGKDRYDIKKIVVAGPWVEVRSVLGVVLYYQVDFYIAAKYKDSDPGVLEIDLVTGKTSGPDINSFGTYSIGSVGEMLEKNLN